jgi:hypothetical protein
MIEIRKLRHTETTFTIFSVLMFVFVYESLRNHSKLIIKFMNEKQKKLSLRHNPWMSIYFFNLQFNISNIR